MTREEVDTLWFQAMHESIRANEEFTRYRFAALVAAAERNRLWTQDHWTEYERAIVAAEQEACAKVCEQVQFYNLMWSQDCADMIRSRARE